MMVPDLVVGEIGFGNNFGASAELEFMRNEDRRQTAEIKDLQAENRELIKRNNRLKRVLERCAALTDAIANEKHEALLEAAQPL
jgi:hypothetical protein